MGEDFLDLCRLIDDFRALGFQLSGSGSGK
jgi:hypothetical protein